MVQASTLKNILSRYEAASSQVINLAKTDVSFSIPTECRNQITLHLDIKEVPSHDKYLGAPTFVGSSWKNLLLFLVDRIKKHMSGWMDKLISWVGKEVLIKVVAHAIPTYLISVFKISKKLCQNIQSSIVRFWSGHNHKDHKIHWISAHKLCKSKHDRGIGFHDMEAFNDALLAKQVWRLIKDGNSLVAQLLHVKYFPDDDIFKATLGIRPSFTWRCLYGARNVVTRVSRWLVGNGLSLSVWDDRWLPRPSSFKPATPRSTTYENYKVSNLIDHDNNCWRESLINNIFLPCDAESIMNIPLCSSWPTDILIWHCNSRGIFTIRSAHDMLVNDTQSSGGSSSSQDKHLWHSIWGCNVPPQINLFGWRACISTLPTAYNILTRVSSFSMTCSICTHCEDRAMHTILECPLAV